MTNLTNGFSGLAIYTDLYYALFDVLNTVFVLAGFLLLDQDVAFNTKRYKHDAVRVSNLLVEEQKKRYDPNTVEPLGDLLKTNVFNRNDLLLNKKGINVNSDGSTNNLAEYTWYSRNTLMKKFKKNYIWFFIWAYISGALVFSISVLCFGEIINSDGHVNNYWNAGVCILFTNIISHHIMIVGETRNFSWFLTLFYTFSICCLFLTIFMNDTMNTSVFYQNQWSFLFSTPLFYLTLFMLLFIVVIPRRIIHIFEHVFEHPEFVHVRG